MPFRRDPRVHHHDAGRRCDADRHRLARRRKRRSNRSKRHFAGMHRLPAKFTRSHSCNPPDFAPAKDYFAMR
jgi:hypothetical protein